MIGIGEIMIAVGVLTLFAGPLERSFTHRRWSQRAEIEEALRLAYPVVSPDPTLDAIAAQAEDALLRSDTAPH